MLLFIWQKIGAIIFSVAGTPLSLGCYDRLSHNLEGFAEDQHPNQVRCNTCDLQLLQSKQPRMTKAHQKSNEPLATVTP